MLNPQTSLRIALFAFGIFGTIFLPAWVPLIAIFILCLLWRAWEALFIGLMLDFLWAPLHTAPFFTFAAIALVWIFEPLRTQFLSR